MTSPLLGLVELQEATPLAHIVFNTNQRILEALVVGVIVSNLLSAPPGSPAESAVYFVTGTGTGAWAGHDDELAIYIQGGWYFVPLFVGQEFYITSSAGRLGWTGATWA